MAIILYATEPTKKNQSNCTQTLQLIQDFITEALRWVQMTTDTGIKFKFETPFKERDKQLLDFISIGILKLEQQHTSSQDIINIFMNLIIYSYFKKQPMSWELIHLRIIHPSDSVMKSMC